MCWFLTTGKTEVHYRECIDRLKEEVTDINPGHCGTDFETGLINACRYAFPNSVHVGCHFHYVQAVRRKRVACGITDALLANNESVKMMFDTSKILTMLPSGDFEEGIKYLEEMVPEPRPQCVQEYIHYLRTYWLRREYSMFCVTCTENFEIHSYLLLGRNVASVFRAPRRTNNDVEIYHKYLIQHMKITTRGNHRPNTFTFLSK